MGLGAIPGVQQVFSRHIVAKDSSYRHCSVVRLASHPVVDSYREHPLHRGFADNRFHPYVGNHLSIDLEECSTEK
jgi:fructose-bisphosphate aldolase class II